MIVSNAVAPDPRVEKEAAALAAAGHVVTVFAWDRSGEAPSHEERDGFRIERLGPSASYGGGMRSLPRFREFWGNVADQVVEWRAEVVHAHDTDTIVPALSAGCQLRRRDIETRLVVDFHELYRASRMVPQRGLPGTVARAYVDRLERRAVRDADLIVVANEGVLPYYKAMGAGRRLVFVPNAPDATLFRPLPCEREGQRPFTVMFIGRKRYARTLEVLASAIQPYPDMAAELLGGGPDATEIDSLAVRFERVSVGGPVPYSTIPAHYACSDVVYAAYDVTVGNALVCTPGKVLEAMACSRPVLVSARTWIGEWVERQGVGVAVNAADPASVGEALVRLRDDGDVRRKMGEQGRRLVESRLNWGCASEVLVEAYTQLGE